MATTIIAEGVNNPTLKEVHESIKRLLPFVYDQWTKYVLDGSGRIRIERRNPSSFSSSVCGERELKTMYERMNN